MIETVEAGRQLGRGLTAAGRSERDRSARNQSGQRPSTQARDGRSSARMTARLPEPYERGAKQHRPGEDQQCRRHTTQRLVRLEHAGNHGRQRHRTRDDAQALCSAARRGDEHPSSGRGPGEQTPIEAHQAPSGFEGCARFWRNLGNSNSSLVMR